MPIPTDEAYWREEVIKAQRDELESTRKAATAWAGLFGAVLGVFGTVTFAGGLTALDDLNEDWQPLVKGATLAAAALALGATLLAGAAAGPSAKTTSDSSWTGRRDAVRKGARTARRQPTIRTLRAR